MYLHGLFDSRSESLFVMRSVLHAALSLITLYLSSRLLGSFGSTVLSIEDGTDVDMDMDAEPIVAAFKLLESPLVKLNKARELFSSWLGNFMSRDFLGYSLVIFG